MNEEKSETTGETDNAEQISVQSKGATAGRQRINGQRVQKVLLIWLDGSINNNNTDCRSTISQLRRIMNNISTFTDENDCLQFISKIIDNKACMIISGSLGQRIVPRIHNMSQVDSIFIFCGNKTYHEQWTKDWSKIKGVFTEISPIYQALKQVVQQREQNAISISLVATGGDDSETNLDELDLNFMYNQIFKEILLKIKFDEEHIQEYINYCRTVFAEDDEELQNVDRLQTRYHRKTPIWWYTCDSFLYSMLNRALRLMDMDIIMKMGFFISDLHRHIEELHFEQFNGKSSTQIFTVYRGQGMSKTDFDKMTKIQGGLISFNNFLLTNKDRQVSLRFAESNRDSSDLVGILFNITINTTKSVTPFASIIDVACYGDEKDEVLFSIYTVFRIGEITPLDENQGLFQVKLTLITDNDKDVRTLTDRIRQETYPDARGWYRLGLLLLKVGEFARAQQVYELLLEQTTDVSEKGRIFYQLGCTKYNEKEYNEAITFYEKALKIFKKTLSTTHVSLAACYNNIGIVYDNIGDYPKALSSHAKSLEIKQRSFPSNHPSFGMSYNNIGMVYQKMGDYAKARLFYEQAVKIGERSLPSSHLDLQVYKRNLDRLQNKL